ncbi:PREDICTED: uncharacterized protein LOC18587173 [Theobroma cacao]|uniref:Uncharacterized protein LOC18587173 n=1 Tax=Theobroma cacao TaxID=3641 RepID=A0AB32UMU4_THECC|nr:PREDICTED: uncharacterized protein LOC18587173 [Theobroma cacao]
MSNSDLEICHLQYADDTAFTLQADLDILLNTRRVIWCFHIIIGLHINFHKGFLYGVGIGQSTLADWATIINCKTDSLPSSYLGIPLGASQSSLHAWQPVIDKLEARLSCWKARKLSMGGRITILNSVLSSLPIYFTSLFHIPARVRDKLERLQRRFLWSGSSPSRKIHLAN